MNAEHHNRRRGAFRGGDDRRPLAGRGPPRGRRALDQRGARRRLDHHPDHGQGGRGDHPRRRHLRRWHDRRRTEAPDGFTVSRAIQTDAAVNPGNSGGPLLDSAGKVIAVAYLGVAYLGVATGTAAGETAGARVAEVVPGSPAAVAGLRQGDVITALGESSGHLDRKPRRRGGFDRRIARGLAPPDRF